MIFFFIVRLLVFFGILYSIVEDWLGVMPSRVVDLFACWEAIGGRFQFDTIWKMILPCLMWCLWMEKILSEL